MFGGHSARRKFGGPEMYAVASRALMAGEEEGKMTEKRRLVREAVEGDDSTLISLSALTK